MRWLWTLLAVVILSCDSDNGIAILPQATPTAANTDTATQVAPTATTAGTPRPVLTPAESTLAAAAATGARAHLHIEADASTPPDADCLQLLAFAMSASSPSAPGRTVECKVPPELPDRHKFSMAADGSLYLDQVFLLVHSKVTLQPIDTSCNSIREQLTPASEPPSNINRIECWQEPPLPIGTAGGQFGIWGVIPESSATAAADVRYC